MTTENDSPSSSVFEQKRVRSESRSTVAKPLKTSSFAHHDADHESARNDLRDSVFRRGSVAEPLSETAVDETSVDTTKLGHFK